MITIEEKLKLFTKIVYDKVEKENQRAVEEFNEKFGNIIEQKKQEFVKEANELSIQSLKKIENEKLHIISKAKIEEKKILLERRKRIFDEALSGLMKYGEEFTRANEYEKLFMRDFKGTLDELKDSSGFDVFITTRDLNRFGSDCMMMLSDKITNIYTDDDIVGGFIISDNQRNIKIDMTIMSRVQGSKEYIGEKLFDMLG
jgi:vacuolar-type H+-ATPase subunit E/Vma4